MKWSVGELPISSAAPGGPLFQSLVEAIQVTALWFVITAVVVGAFCALWELVR